MTATLDIFTSVWKYWMVISLVLAFVGFYLVRINKLGSFRITKRSIIGLIFIGQVFLTWGIGFGSFLTIQKQARQEFKEFLLQSELSVKINGQTYSPEKSKEIINEFSKIENYKSHHSHPLEKIKVDISSAKETITILIGQDSEIENEYWIFWNKYKSLKSNEIGKIRTEIFINNGG